MTMNVDGIPEQYLVRQDDGSLRIKREWWEIPAEEGAPSRYPKPPHPNDVLDLFVLQHENTMKNMAHPDSYPNPFNIEDSKNNRGSPEEWGDIPRPIVELRMCALSAAIRDKKNWQEKMKNPRIMSKWRQEALLQKDSGNFLPEQALTEEMVHYVLGELEGYAKLIDVETGIQVGCCERVWKSDTLIPHSLLSRLLQGVSVLEDVPDREKDWHPGSEGRVLDLLHPSLYPLVYKSSLEKNLSTGEFCLIKPQSPYDSIKTYSERYTWIPSDFIISADKDSGNRAKLIPGTYINNLHPDDYGTTLYPVIEDILSLAIPMFERVLSDLKRPLTKFRIKSKSEWIFTNFTHISVNIIPCIWRKKGHSLGPPLPGPDIDTEDWEEEDYEKYQETQRKKLPRPLLEYDGALDRIRDSPAVSLAGSTIQVICKLANIVLTPENPCYPGGSWHVEGMMNEEIVSTFIYYYDEVNITESRLAFRTSVVEPKYHGQNDDRCTGIVYGLKRDSHLVQDIGSIRTCKGRCIAFPNIYQHQVQPFQLSDATTPGHRKILAFFLINPVRHIPSTTTIPPQQHEWVARATRQVLSKLLPPELVEIVVKFLKEPLPGHKRGHLISRKKAERVRAKLMKERSTSALEHQEDKFQVPFNMCEH